MPSTLGWIDYDDQQRESMKRVLAFFRERDSRDELGLGTVRDSFADQLFPGTSTIQTRLRYMLFVPWIYRRLEAQRVAGAEVGKKARKAELALIAPLLENGESGVIGSVAGLKLKTLPSSIYWAGLASWGVLRYPGSQSDYHRAFDRLTERRSNARRREDLDVADEWAASWHGGLPEPPEDFPDVATFALRPVEAEYLRDRLREEHPESLLALLAQEGGEVPEEAFIWQHPRIGSFRPVHKDLVHHAQVFAEVMHGAALLYNVELARLRGGKELVDQHTASLASWVDTINETETRARILDLSLERLWALVRTERHVISEATRDFVGHWFEIARVGSLAVADGRLARRLVRQRERTLKRAQSRFDNRVALAQWSGWSGLRVLTYRWGTARTMLQDLSAGLAAEEG